MMANVSSGLTKYKVLLMDTGQADMGNQQGDRVIGEPTGEAWQGGQAVVKGKWGRLGHGGNWLGTNGGKWGRLGHGGNWLGTNGGKWDRLGHGGTDWGKRGQRMDKERPHKTRDFEKCASMPKTSLLLRLSKGIANLPWVARKLSHPQNL